MILLWGCCGTFGFTVQYEYIFHVISLLEGPSHRYAKLWLFARCYSKVPALPASMIVQIAL